MHAATQSTLKTNNLLEEIGCKSSDTPTIFEDNDGARAIVSGKVGDWEADVDTWHSNITKCESPARKAGQEWSGSVPRTRRQTY